MSCPNHIATSFEVAFIFVCVVVGNSPAYTLEIEIIMKQRPMFEKGFNDGSYYAGSAFVSRKPPKPDFASADEEFEYQYGFAEGYNAVAEGYNSVDDLIPF